MPSATTKPIRLALIGAGIFAREAHAPALAALAEAFEVVAIFSRSAESAARLNALLPAPAQPYHDLPALLARQDIEAVDIVLPIDVVPYAVEMALAAGKHVLSEKPMAPDVATGRRLLATWAGVPDRVWMVAENYRYEQPFVKAAEIVASGGIGRPLACQWALHVDMAPDNKYFQTAWRHTGTYQGGFVLDGGVHQIAALRMVVGEIAAVSAVASHVRPDLPPVDTLTAALRFQDGAVGAYSITYAAGAPWFAPLDVVGEQGALRVWEHEVALTSGGETRSIPAPRYDGVRGELAAFAGAIRQGEAHRNTPQECLRDVAVIEAMLRSAESGQQVAVEGVSG